MAKYASRGTLLKLTISASLTTIAQVRSIRIGDTTTDVLQVDALDDSGISHDFINAGTATQDDITAELFYDPDNSTHTAVTGFIASNTALAAGIAGSVVFPDGTPDSGTFTAIGLGFGSTVTQGEALVGNLTIKLDGVFIWPT